MNAEQNFRLKCPTVMHTLMGRYHWRAFQAAGPVGNMGLESSGFTKLREIGQPEGRGGYGWAQWTGPRRVDFFDFCKLHRLDWTSDEANMQYLMHDLDGAYRSLVRQVAETHTLEQAVEAWEKYYERAGVVAMDKRNAWARIALDAYNHVYA